MFSYMFYLDGSISVEVRASGYIQSAFYANNQDYGFQIQDALSGSMHDHVLNFKADFDILGTANSVQLMRNTPVTTTYPWSGNKTRNTMKLTRSFIESEDDGRFNWDANAQTQVIVVNQDEKNSYGEYRGYRILPSAGTAHLTVQNSSNTVNSAHFAEYDIQVSQRKDTEPRSAHAYANQDVHNPPINFAEFFDGESLEQEDLVVWFNLGMHHGTSLHSHGISCLCICVADSRPLQFPILVIFPTQSSQLLTVVCNSCRPTISLLTSPETLSTRCASTIRTAVQLP